ncbi:proline-rich receptor kinase PERK9 [Micractinium conductrix]|uniref:Proline-rich receptor kinase PERK9 n=1 Tax=Micractinium conductrix TaxID=554055 RepID=A0A2P6VII1_9CHLO|nr:proline-rich receptor kinase PERK9 [Micractinium conductrix]|eukprot:PSC73899.1 proline-rich receptor kinase PERK9 [Micractinium conductrix]
MARPGRAFLAAATALLLALSAPAAATDAAPSLLMMAAGSLPATANFAGLSRSTPAACDAGGSSDDHHDVPLRTYILTASRFNLRRAAASDGGSTHELRLPLDALPPFVPFVLNAAASGKGLRQGLIDPTRFLHDWAATMRAAARLLPGRHAMPGVAIEAQCSGGGNNTVEGLVSAGVLQQFTKAAPTNAHLLLHGPRKAAVLADIDWVRVEGDEAVLSLRWEGQPDIVPEGSGCHAEQAADAGHRHYHHQGMCGYELQQEDPAQALQTLMQNGERGVTLFIKCGVTDSPPPPAPSPSPPPPTPSPPPPPTPSPPPPPTPSPPPPPKPSPPPPPTPSPPPPKHMTPPPQKVASPPPPKKQVSPPPPKRSPPPPKRSPPPPKRSPPPPKRTPPPPKRSPPPPKRTPPVTPPRRKPPPPTGGGRGEGQVCNRRQRCAAGLFCYWSPPGAGGLCRKCRHAGQSCERAGEERSRWCCNPTTCQKLNSHGIGTCITHELRLPLDALTPFVPFVLNAAASGKGLHQGLIDATRFLIDWAAAMQTVARLHPGRHAAPVAAIEAQCSAGGNDTVEGFVSARARKHFTSAAPANAQMLLHGPRKVRFRRTSTNLSL